MPVTPLSSSTEVSGSSTLRTRTIGVTPIASATCAMWPMVSTEYSECCMSMKMKSWPVVFAMRAMSPERTMRTFMPSTTSPASRRSFAGLGIAGPCCTFGVAVITESPSDVPGPIRA